MASVTFSLISSIVPVSCIAFCCSRNLRQYQLRCCYCWVCCWCCMAFCFGITVLLVRLLLLPCCAAQLCRSSCLMPVFFLKVIPPWLCSSHASQTWVPPSSCCGWRCCCWCCCYCSWQCCWCPKLGCHHLAAAAGGAAAGAAATAPGSAAGVRILWPLR